MKITWLAQAGLLLEANGTRIMIDPYLSDSIHEKDPTRSRSTAPDLRYFDADPDILIFTHNHIDHYDPLTAPKLLARGGRSMTVLCPTSVWQVARTEGGGHNYVQFNRHTEWTERGLRFYAVKAEHSDDYAIGVVIEDLSDGRRYYVTGDTLYSKDVLADVGDEVYCVLLPINGVGNNMNTTDAARLAAAVGAQVAIPLHYGLYDTLDPTTFDCPVARIIPPYQETEI